MSDRDAPDPMDKAYAQAEAVLSDEAARAARRARVLAAVAAAPAAEPAPKPRRSVWRPGGWLVAASVAGLSVLVALRFYPPVSTPPQVAAPPPQAPPAAQAPAPLPQPALQAPPQMRKPAPPPQAAVPAPAARDAAPVQLAEPASSPPLPAPPPPQRMAAPAPPPAASAQRPAEVQDLVVTGQRKAAVVQDLPTRAFAPPARGPAPAAPPVAGPRASAEVSDMVVLPSERRSTAKVIASGTPDERAERLRAAAAAGETRDITALLARRTPVDAADEAGETALMKAVQARQPAAAALLRGRGADPDRKNNAGVSAREMAMAIGDAALNRALGLTR